MHCDEDEGKDKDTDTEMEPNKDENYGEGEEGGNSENPHSNPKGAKSKNEALNPKEGDNPNAEETEQSKDFADTILDIARNCTLEFFNFQKWVVENITSMQGKQRELEDKINKLIKMSNSGKQNKDTENNEVD